MAFTPTAEQLAEKFEFVTSRALRLKEGYAFVTGTLDEGIATGAGDDEQLLADSFQVLAMTGIEETSVAAAPLSNTGAMIVDLLNYTEFKFTARVSGPSDIVRMKLYFQTGDNSSVNSIPLNDDGAIERTDWESIPETSRTLTALGYTVYDGDDNEDIEVGALIAYFRR